MGNDKKMDEKLIAAVDLGTYKTCLAVAKVEGNNTQILYYKSAPSDGIRNSEVFNPKKTAEVLGGLIRNAEEELNIKILQAVVGLPRCNIRQEDASATVQRIEPDDCITREEVEAMKIMAQDSHDLKDPDNEKIYGAIAQSFSTGDYFQIIENDIIGMISDEFTGHFKVFIGKKFPIRNITKVFNDLGIGIARMYFTPLATAKAVLTEEETSNGVALIDLGAGATSVSIYDKKVLAYYSSIPFGGNSISTDIKNECSISDKLAESIKCAFGGCMPDKLQNLGEKIIQIETDDMSSYKQIPVSYLSEIITARVKEIIDAMLYEIQESQLAERLRKGIVITGGGAELLNITNYIKEISGYNVRIAYPRNGFVATGCEDILRTDAVSTVGLVMMSRDENLNCCINNDMSVEEPAKGPEVIREEPAKEKTVKEEPEAAPETPQQPEVKEPEVPVVQEPAKPEPEKIEKKPEEPKAKKPGLFKKFIWKVNKIYEDANNETV